MVFRIGGSMRFAVLGAGAIGGFLAGRLIEAGQDVALIARGPHLAALREHGLRLQSDELGEAHYPSVEATDDPAAIGPVDYVILGLKANALVTAASSARPLLGEKTAVVSTQNGLPWWYFHGTEEAGAPLESVDPGGVIAEALAPERAIGAIMYCSCSLPEPGIVRHTSGIRVPLGEPDGSRSDRVLKLSDAFGAGGLKAPVRNQIQHDLWVKLFGNGVFNPLSALTGKTMLEMVELPETHRLIAAMMEEIREVAAAAGVQIAFSPEQRIEGARRAGYHKTSMLQDREAGRPPELDAILGSILELAERFHVAAPRSEAIYAAAKLLFEKPATAP